MQERSQKPDQSTPNQSPTKTNLKLNGLEKKKVGLVIKISSAKEKLCNCRFSTAAKLSRTKTN